MPAIKITNSNDELVYLVKDKQRRYIDEMHKSSVNVQDDYKLNGLTRGLDTFPKIDLYQNNKVRYYLDKPYKISFETSMEGKFCLVLSLDKKFTNSLVLTSNKKYFLVSNLIPGQTYFYKVIQGDNVSEIKQFTVANYLRTLRFGKSINVRDFGGRMTKYGKRVKYGLLIRGCELTNKEYHTGEKNTFHEAIFSKKSLCDLKQFMGGSGIEVDLRGVEESNNQTKSIIDGFDYLGPLPISPYDWFFENCDEVYCEIMQKIFKTLSQANKKPVYLHCWGGADRTGTICFILGAILGMSYTDLIIDYEFTTFSGNRRMHYQADYDYEWIHFVQMYEKIEQYNIENNLDGQLSEVIEHFVINKFHISKDAINKIKKVFLE